MPKDGMRVFLVAVVSCSVIGCPMKEPEMSLFVLLTLKAWPIMRFNGQRLKRMKKAQKISNPL
jgi:hypothetical protein